MYALVAFTVFQKLFTVLSIYTFLFASLKLILKMITKTPQNSLFDVLQCRPVIGCRENVPNAVATGGFWHYFTGGFQYECRVQIAPEEGY
jgi:hypothetical protein